MKTPGRAQLSIPLRRSTREGVATARFPVQVHTVNTAGVSTALPSDHSLSPGFLVTIIGHNHTIG